MCGYAVIDVETTGFSPAKQDRIAEIAVIHVDPLGRVTGEWATLVNPMRDLGPTSVHGICAADVRVAPRFSQIAGTLTRLLADRVLVAHNLAFDLLFLTAEYARLGVKLAVRPHLGLCTMRLAHQLLPEAAARSLRACCAAAGVPLTSQHEAVFDARAAALLLAHYLDVAGQPPPWESLLRQAPSWPWPQLPCEQTSPVRRGHGTGVSASTNFLARIVERLPRAADPMVDSYLAVLDDALLDRHISASEAEALVTLANDLGLDQRATLDAHLGYLAALAVAAWQDGRVTDQERSDLEQVAALLSLTSADVDRVLADVLESGAPLELRSATVAGSLLNRPRLCPDDQIVFTGEMSQPREVWEKRARAVGLRPHSGVTKKTRLVVASDPDTLSDKGRKARQYGVPIIAEDAFAQLLRELDPIERDM